MTYKEGGKAQRNGFRRPVRLLTKSTLDRRSIIVNHEQTYRGSFRSDLQASGTLKPICNKLNIFSPRSHICGN